MRIDKFLKISRILKRRTLGKEACEGGRVSVNEKEVKPSYNLKVGDVVSIRFATKEIKFKVENLKENVKKDEAQTIYTIIEE
ncbi:MAG: RNA-binding S4 domain-containing protein [Clostridia bacterium]|nr:RNA-binding S4 domain-containing protein [Clostridia bacterium]